MAVATPVEVSEPTVSQVVREITINPKQREFFGHKEKYLLYGGAKGGGKSWAIRTKQLMRRIKYPGSHGLTLRRKFPELQRTHLDKIAVEWKGFGEFNKQEKKFYFSNGSIQEFGHCQYEMNVADYQGAEYDDIGIDEATQFTEYMINTFKTNIRTVRTDLKTQMYLSANPGGVGHGYIKRTFVKETTRLEDHAFVPAKVFDNHILMLNDPEYAANLAKLPDKLREAFLNGNWDIFEGQAFTDWDDAKHVSSRFPISLDACKRIICFDWGYNAPGCANFLGFAPENSKGVKHIYHYREIYMNMKTPEEWGQVLKLYCKMEKIAYMVLPHDCFANVQGKPSIAQTFQEIFGHLTSIVRGQTLVQGARHNRMAKLHDKLLTSVDGTPYLIVHPNCKNTIRTIPELIIDPNDPEDIDTDGEDHAYDALTLGLSHELGSTQRGGAVVNRPQKRAHMHPTVTIREDNSIKGPDFWDELAQKVGATSARR